MNVNEGRSTSSDQQQRVKRARNNNSSNNNNNITMSTTTTTTSTNTTTTQSSSSLSLSLSSSRQQQPRVQHNNNNRLIIDQFCGANQRSFPGQPIGERYDRTYNKPFKELTFKQRAAAREILGIVCEDIWELAMPRRIYGHSGSIVLTFQTKIWNQLSSEHQTKAMTYLDMDEQFWNEILAPFHDDLWTIEGVTLTYKEFDKVLSIISKMSQNLSLKLFDVATFLLSLDKLLLPSQGVLLSDTLKSSPCFDSLKSDANKFHYFSHHMLIASFLSDPFRFVSMSYLQLLRFWDDDMSGCAWGNAAGQQQKKRQNINDVRKQTYSVTLCELHKKRLNLRRCVGPILCGTLPAKFYYDNNNDDDNTNNNDNINDTTIVSTTTTVQQQQQQNPPPIIIRRRPPPPHLPKHLVKFILDEMLGIGQETIDPCTVEWLTVYGISLHDIILVDNNKQKLT